MFERKFQILVIIGFITSMLSGCIDNTNTDTIDADKTTIIMDNVKIILNESKVNISDVSVKTAIRNYIVPGDNQSGVLLDYVDGFQPESESDAGTVYHLHGTISNVAGEQLDKVTINITFTSLDDQSIKVFKTKKYTYLTKDISHNFDIYVYDDVESYNLINYVIMEVYINSW